MKILRIGTIVVFAGTFLIQDLTAGMMTKRPLPRRIVDNSEEWMILRDSEKANVFYLAPKVVYADQSSIPFDQIDEDFCIPYKTFREVKRDLSVTNRTFYRILRKIAEAKSEVVLARDTIASLEAEKINLEYQLEGFEEGDPARDVILKDINLVQSRISSILRAQENHDRDITTYEAHLAQLQSAKAAVEEDFKARAREVNQPELRIRVRFSFPPFPAKDANFRAQHGFLGEDVDILKWPSQVIGLDYHPNRLDQMLVELFGEQILNSDEFGLLMPRWLPAPFENDRRLIDGEKLLPLRTQWEEFPRSGFEYHRYVSIREACNAKARRTEDALVDNVSVVYSIPIYRDPPAAKKNGDLLIQHAFSFRGRADVFAFLRKFEEPARIQDIQNLIDEGDPLFFDNNGFLQVQDYSLNILPKRGDKR